MSHFRKMLLAVAAVASFFGAADSAKAQANPYVCNTSFSPLVVRSEGLRELVLGAGKAAALACGQHDDDGAVEHVSSR